MCNPGVANPGVILVKLQRLHNLVRNFAALRTPRLLYYVLSCNIFIASYFCML